MNRVESDKEKYGSKCPTHGPLEDPIIALIGTGADTRAAFACPWWLGVDVIVCLAE